MAKPFVRVHSDHLNERAPGTNQNYVTSLFGQFTHVPASHSATLWNYATLYTDNPSL